MFRRILSTTKRWVSVNVFGRSPIQNMSALELERRIRKLERQKKEYKDDMTTAKKEYDEKIQEAQNADETRIPEIKSEASRLLSKYEAIRSQWMETLVGLRFMQQAALGKQISADGPEALPSNMNPQQFEAAANEIEDKIAEREDNIDGWNVAAQRMEGISQGGSAHMEAMADERVEAAVDAARDGEDVPTLEELADDTFSDVEETVSEDEAEASASTSQRAGEAEHF